MKAKEGIGWQAALVDINRATEFAGDDVDRFSALIDLGRECSGVVIDIPALSASAAVSVYGQRDGEVDTVPKQVYHIMPDDGTVEAWATAVDAGGYVVHCPVLGAVRYIRLHCSTNQAADRTFYVLGTN